MENKRSKTTVATTFPDSSEYLANMMRILVAVAILCLAVMETPAQRSASWSCADLTPNLGSLKGKPPSSPDTSPYQISLPSTTVQAGHELQGKWSSLKMIKQFLI